MEKPMAPLSRRAVLGTGAAILGALDSALAVAQTTPAPRRGGSLVSAQLSGNRRGGDATNSRHPYFMVDLITRSAYNTLAWVDEELKLQLELATRIEPADETLQVWEATIREGVRFHDGRVMTAADVASSFELHRRRNFASQHIQRTEVVNPATIRFHRELRVPLRAGRERLRRDAGQSGHRPHRPRRHRHGPLPHHRQRPAAADDPGALRRVLAPGLSLP
jgi:ABC-type transport system substrate-binding protein